MPVALGDILELVVNTSMYAQKFNTVLHYVVSNPVTQVNPVTSAGIFLGRMGVGGATDIITTMRACCSDNLSIDSMTAQYVAPIRFVKAFAAVGVSGTVAGAAGASNLAAVIEKTTLNAGRKFRGSVHLPGISNTSYASGLITGGMVTAMTAWATRLYLPVTEPGGTGVWSGVIWHRHDVPNTSNTPLFDFKVQTSLRVMRRRTVGVGQ